MTDVSALGPRARLAWDIIQMLPTDGIPNGGLHVMDIVLMEELTGEAPGSFVKNPTRVYMAFQHRVGACMMGQFIPDNVLSMSDHGYASDTERTASTGAEQIVEDGMVIDSPEAVAEHLEKFVFPQFQRDIAAFPAKADKVVADIIANERAMQQLLGPDILRTPSGDAFGRLPYLYYTCYGYANYFMAYALYPELMERHFAIQADLATLQNQAAARAIIEGNLPRMLMLDHDMADSRGTLVDVQSLDRLWFPQFARCIKPYLDAGIRLVWHCDGNLMAMVPRLIEAGLGGFQGFQYEDNMDYPAICKMKTRDGDDLFITAGVSVTRTLPFGTRQDVIDQLNWLVEYGPKRGLLLGLSSSATPNTNRDNIRTCIEGLAHYRIHGRSGGAFTKA